MSGFVREWESLAETIVTCRRCPRLVAWREEVARTKRRAYRDDDYWGKPVPGFGDPQARVLAVGLAPGAHGANRTGRLFTGDASGDFLFRALHRAGFASQPTASSRDDGLELKDLYIAAVCRCAPPGNRPTPDEIARCLPYLEQEIRLLVNLRVIVALGRIAFEKTLQIYRQPGNRARPWTFAHGAVHFLDHGMPALIASYHPSRQNTQTGRLTEEMFAAVWERARSFLDES